MARKKRENNMEEQEKGMEEVAIEEDKDVSKPTKSPKVSFDVWFSALVKESKKWYNWHERELKVFAAKQGVKLEGDSPEKFKEILEKY